MTTCHMKYIAHIYSIICLKDLTELLFTSEFDDDITHIFLMMILFISQPMYPVSL